MRKSLVLVLVFICSISINAQIIPAPESLKINKGHFVLDTSTGIMLKGIKSSESFKLTTYLIDKIEAEKVIHEIKQMDSDFEASFEEFKGFLSSTFLVRAKGDKRVAEACLSIKEWAN